MGHRSDHIHIDAKCCQRCLYTACISKLFRAQARYKSTKWHLFLKFLYFSYFAFVFLRMATSRTHTVMAWREFWKLTIKALRRFSCMDPLTSLQWLIMWQGTSAKYLSLWTSQSTAVLSCESQTVNNFERGDALSGVLRQWGMVSLRTEQN